MVKTSIVPNCVSIDRAIAEFRADTQIGFDERRQRRDALARIDAAGVENAHRHGAAVHAAQPAILHRPRPDDAKSSTAGRVPMD